ncbi:MAG: DUF2182 domain-containing protein [Betaproteobacteria bacterium]|nr:DUF2182 domain-containing protein [Betaproteobacteria bacterium]
MPGIILLLLCITLSAWGFLIYQNWEMTNLPMSEMWMPPNSAWEWTISDFSIVYLMWAVMMAAMMLPTALPVIQLFRKTCQQRYGSDFPFSYLFSLAYLLIWFGFSIVLTLLQWQLHSAQWLSGMMENTNTILASAILITAGIYQFTSLKNACLNHCRSPLGFLLNFWKNGNLGAFKMGILHGVTCLGCCWAQMLIMFVVGVMNITGMVLITLFILIEKGFLDKKHFISKTSGSLLCVWGIILLIL